MVLLSNGFVIRPVQRTAFYFSPSVCVSCFLSFFLSFFSTPTHNATWLARTIETAKLIFCVHHHYFCMHWPTFACKCPPYTVYLILGFSVVCRRTVHSTAFQTMTIEMSGMVSFQLLIFCFQLRSLNLLEIPAHVQDGQGRSYYLEVKLLLKNNCKFSCSVLTYSL